MHDFLDETLGKAIPYGVYDVARNKGWVNVGVDHDTGEFAVASIERWWRTMGIKAYPDAKELLVTAGARGPRTTKSASLECSGSDGGSGAGRRKSDLLLTTGTCSRTCS